MPLYKELFENAPDAQFLVDNEGLIHEVNTHAQILFGYGYEEIVGHSIEMLIPHRFSKNHHNHRQNYQKKPRTRPMGIGMSLFGLHKNGKEIPVDVQLSPVGDGTLCVVRDASSKKVAEERFQSLLDDKSDSPISTHFFYFFLPIFALVLISAIAINYVTIKERVKDLSAPELVLVTQSALDFQFDISRTIPKLLSLAYKEPKIQNVLDHYPDISANEMVDGFSTVLTRNPSYRQIRWIDEDGLERVRVNTSRNGSIVITDTPDLQNKSDRYYVKKSLKLDRGEVYVSPVDLNVEQGAIETPYQPMVRLTTRVFHSDGSQNGLFIVNFSVLEALGKFAEHLTESHLYLLNSDGFWLSSPFKDDEWGFMLGKQRTFSTDHPMIWQKITEASHGQLLDTTGLWTWESIQVPRHTTDNVTPLKLMVVSHIPPGRIQGLKFGVWSVSLVVVLFLMVLIGYIVWKLSIEYEWRQRSQAKLARTVDDLTRRNQELDEFAYIASHDLKEPLRGIHNYANFLSDDYSSMLDDEGKHFLGRIQHLAERQNKLLSQLLDYSRIGQTELSRSNVDLNQLLEGIHGDLSSFLEEKGINLTIQPMPMEYCNELRTQEVFQNLIVNAAKYNDKENKQVDVGVDMKTTPPVYFVQDNGIGIPPKHQEIVFRIFKRLHEQDKYGGGSGAGLTIVKKIIEKHGGRIWLESSPGVGTTFFFTLREANNVT